MAIGDIAGCPVTASAEPIGGGARLTLLDLENGSLLYEIDFDRTDARQLAHALLAAAGDGYGRTHAPVAIQANGTGTPSR